MPNGKDKNKLGDFRYVTFNQIDKLEKLHPLVHKFIPREKFRRLLSCPDVSDGFPCFFYVADDEKIYSHLSAFPDKLSADGKTYRWAWTGDLVTDPVYRGRGLAKRVVEETIEVLHQRDFIAGGGFATEVTIHIYKKLGFALPGYVSRYLFLKTARPFLEYHLKSKLIRRIADLFYRALVLSLRPFLQIRARQRKFKVLLDQISIHGDTAFNTNFPELFYRAKYHFNDCLAKIIWKIKWTQLDTTLYVMKDETTEEPLCYFVIGERDVKRPMLDKYGNFRLMTVMDYGFFTDDVKVYGVLIDKVFRLFWKSDADVLEVISSSNILNGYAKRIGMIKVGKGVPFMFTLPPKCHLSDDCRDLNNWHLTHYTGEGFSIR